MTTEALKDLSTEDLKAILEARIQQEAEQKNRERSSYEVIKEDTIQKLFKQALSLHHQLKKFKDDAFNEAGALYDLLQKYSKRHADGKGNFSMKSADGNIKLSLKRQELGYFDERSNQAEKHIIDFVGTQFKGDPRTQKLITSLLERTKGKLDIKLVQKLYTMENDYDDANWKEGIKLLKESWTPSDSKEYLSISYNDKPIVLDFASI